MNLRLRRYPILALLATAFVVVGCSSDPAPTNTSSTTKPAVSESSSPPGTPAASESAVASESSAAPGSSSAPGTSGSGETPSGEPILIGHTAGLTGFMSVFDIPVSRGVQMAIDDINAAGGLLGRPVELITTDNATDVGKVQSAAEQILADGADMIITSCDYDIGGPAARVANGKDVLAFGCAGSPNFGVTGIGPLTYNVNPGSVVEGVLIAEYAHDKGYTKPFVLSDISLEFTQVAGEKFIERWESLGGTLAGQDTFNNTDASVEAQVGAIRASGADVIYVASYPPGGVKALAEIRTQGLDLPIFGNLAFDGTYWIDTVSDLSNFTIANTGSLYGDDPVAERNEFFVRFEKAYGEPAASSFYPLAGYSAMQAYAKAVTKAGSTDTAAVQAALNTFDNEPLLMGATTFTETCHIPATREYLMITYTDGKPAVVDTYTPKEIPGDIPC